MSPKVRKANEAARLALLRVGWILREVRRG